jgi:N-methylhydantoinase A
VVAKRAAASTRARLAVDIGGTFTDVVLHVGKAQWTAKVLTTPQAPEEGVLDSVRHILGEAGIDPARLDLMILGTTLATNALIERKGAVTALVTTEGFRDTLEIAHEHRFAQYDIFLDKPEPLVPRYLRLPVAERMNSKGDVLLPLDDAAIEALVPVLRKEGVRSVAVCFLHSYANPSHERRVRDALKRLAPDLYVTLSSDVCPEVREYERVSTTCANAYVQPVMAGYLRRLDERLRGLGMRCPLYLMTSGGALTTLELGAEQPVRLVESGPAGGAVLARAIAEAGKIPRALSFDMGGTTAKICFIDDYTPQVSRSFEFGRVYRFLKGSGQPIRIPVIEMVEIGAGGGSIARVDELKRVAVGPDSAGSEPGPACYGRGGTAATVTDADVALGRIDPALFAAGSIPLDPQASDRALLAAVGRPLGLDATMAALAVSEIVEENMANAARVHAMELGKDVEQYTLIAFGGAAPVHACRLARKLGVQRVIIPSGAGVGSALGFLWAPVAFHAVRSWYQRLDAFDVADGNRMLAAMRTEALEVVRKGAGDVPLVEERLAYMRYVGQGHEITVTLPNRALTAADVKRLQAAFHKRYAALYGRAIPHLCVEVLSWSLMLSTKPAKERPATRKGRAAPLHAQRKRRMFEATTERQVDAPVYAREAMAGGGRVTGPAVIVEAQTTTIVGAGFRAHADAHGHLVLERTA